MSDIGGCCALQSKAEAAEATRIVQWLGLPSHHDSQKNWDTLKALHYILALNEPGAPVLDAGSSGDSAILKWLNLLGFGKLYACDIRPKPSAKYSSRQIEFSVQDLTRTNYPDVFFKVVTCISVIEHGVDLNRFMAEMARVLKPGGVLLISTDYWSEPIDCHGIYPYGEAMGEMKVFQPEDIRGLVRLAERQGLDLCAPLRLETGERAVRWERVDRDYTFAFLPFRKA
jgi:SAM-dependent methyltransferase